MKSIISAAILGLCAANEEAFMEHITKYNLSYGTRAEYEFRFAQYMQADAEIKALNASPDHELATFGHNHLSTWTEKEKMRLRGAIEPAFGDDQEPEYFEEANAWTAIDWRNKGAVTPVQFQGACSSCWAFGATAALEGNYKVKSGKLIKMSEQQFVDCVTDAHGCSGGWDHYCYKYLQSHKFEKEADYPYVKKQTSCQYNSKKGVYQTTGYTQVASQSPGQMHTALSRGVLSAAIKTDQPDKCFDHYTGGIITAACPGSTDHQVAIVGYGAQNGHEYWIIKNSWAASWGENGYARLAKDDTYGSACIQKNVKMPKL